LAELTVPDPMNDPPESTHILVQGSRAGPASRGPPRRRPVKWIDRRRENTTKGREGTMIRRTLIALAAAALAVGMLGGAAHAGEVTGNGKLLQFDGKWGTGLHARSFCAFSGQQALQFFTDDTDAVALPAPTKGIPSHAQSWGQIPKAVRDVLTTQGLNPGIACNPNKSTFGEP